MAIPAARLGAFHGTQEAWVVLVTQVNPADFGVALPRARRSASVLVPTSVPSGTTFGSDFVQQRVESFSFVQRALLELIGRILGVIYGPSWTIPDLLQVVVVHEEGGIEPARRASFSVHVAGGRFFVHNGRLVDAHVARVVRRSEDVGQNRRRQLHAVLRLLVVQVAKSSASIRYARQRQ